MSDPASTSPAPYVLVHGFADDAATWDPLVPHLAQAAGGAAVHAWDLPGHGSRAGSSDASDRDAAIADLQACIAALEQPVALVGHSLGGYLALLVTIDRPELVSSLTLISSGPGFRKDSARAAWNDYIDRIAAKSGMPAHVTALAHQPDSYVIDHVGEVQCPLVHVIGERDARYRAGADYLRSALPHSGLVVIDGAGHHPQRTHPQQVAAAAASVRLQRSHVDV